MFDIATSSHVVIYSFNTLHTTEIQQFQLFVLNRYNNLIKRKAAQFKNFLGEEISFTARQPGFQYLVPLFFADTDGIVTFVINGNLDLCAINTRTSFPLRKEISQRYPHIQRKKSGTDRLTNLKTGR